MTLPLTYSMCIPMQSEQLWGPQGRVTRPSLCLVQGQEVRAAVGQL